ncbi:hypothetical protein CsatA_027073 [Cannabis sativa]
MATTRSKNVIPLKLLIDTKEKRVLFAEAGKDFTDFLFSLLSMPVGTIIRLLSAKGMVGTLGKLYQSFEDLSETYIQTNVDKNILLKPKSSALGESSTHLLLTNEDTTSHVLTFVSPPKSTNVGGSSSSGAEVEGMIMDDLQVKPMSTISSIAMLNTFNVKDVGALQEKTVSVGINEGLKLLKASLQTKIWFLLMCS